MNIKLLLFTIGATTVAVMLSCAPVSNSGSTSTLTLTRASPTLNNTPTLTTSRSTLSKGSIQVERVFSNLSFIEMTNLVQPDDAKSLIFITEQRGVIHAFNPNQLQIGSHLFLDIRDRVNRGGEEEGLLGLAFDPNYGNNGYFYVYYSAANPRRSVVSRFSIDTGNPVIADPQSELIIMEVSQPFSNHNGGQLAFGPDGYLYIGLGDGGGAGDPQKNGQNPNTLLGKILRIDVGSMSAEGTYRIPADNPFVNTTGSRAEIWAYGLRNPWRFTFDKETGFLWCADVGQNRWEEVDIITKGSNYGWNIMEGLDCYSPSTGCNQSGLILPVVEYDHSQGCSVTGGHVYRGEIAALRGQYIYGDYCSGKIWALDYRGNAQVTNNTLIAESGLSITSFGEDLAGNFYVLSREGGIFTLHQGK
jgi:glucose/arabinose dehydrogenase